MRLEPFSAPGLSVHAGCDIAPGPDVLQCASIPRLLVAQARVIGSVLGCLMSEAGATLSMPPSAAAPI